MLGILSPCAVLPVLLAPCAVLPVLLAPCAVLPVLLAPCAVLPVLLAPCAVFPVLLAFLEDLSMFISTASIVPKVCLCPNEDGAINQWRIRPKLHDSKVDSRRKQ
jgi:hypothetical protein